MANLRTRLDTVRRMGVRQLACRLQRRWRQRYVYPKRAGQLFPLPEQLTEPDAPIPFHERRAASLRPRKELLRQADALVARRFTYLGLPSEDLGEPADWQRAPLDDPLWQYTLHYGQWAVDLLHALLVTDARRYRGTCIELMEDWLEGNPVGSRPAWDPYPICRRVVAWSRLAGGLATERSIGRRFFYRRVEPSLRQQATFLAANLELDVPNNHLIANYKALAWLGLLFPHWPEAEAWKAQGMDDLWREMRRQVLPDGVHDERSLSYHCIVLQDLLEVRWLATQRAVSLPHDVDPTLHAMLNALQACRMASGHWPMTADSVAGYPCDPASLLRAGCQVLGTDTEAASEAGDDAWYPAWLSGGPEQPALETPSISHPETSRIQVLEDAGWAILQGDDGSSLFFDAGPLGPDAVLGHAHADALSFELHAPGQPLLVDPGVCTYRAGALRDRFRSTAVHNTVTVDGVDQCQFWGPFRVAYPPAVTLHATDDSVLAHHNGYRRHGILHERTVRFVDGGWIVHDQLTGKGHHRYRLALQLAPSAEATLEASTPGTPCLRGEAHWPSGVRLRLDVVQAPDDLHLDIESGEVSPTWNTILPAPRWSLTWQATGANELIVRLSIH